MATAGEERTPVSVLEREIKRVGIYMYDGVHRSKGVFFIATLANPAARNSAILPVFTMCS